MNFLKRSERDVLQKALVDRVWNRYVKSEILNPIEAVGLVLWLIPLLERKELVDNEKIEKVFYEFDLFLGRSKLREV